MSYFDYLRLGELKSSFGLIIIKSGPMTTRGWVITDNSIVVASRLAVRVMTATVASFGSLDAAEAFDEAEHPLDAASAMMVAAP